MAPKMFENGGSYARKLAEDKGGRITRRRRAGKKQAGSIEGGKRREITVRAGDGPACHRWERRIYAGKRICVRGPEGKGSQLHADVGGESDRG